MILACPSPVEEARLAALKELEILDSPPEEAFDRITRLAKTVLLVPIVAVSLLDHDRQWFKSRQGITATETPRDVSFCAHAIEQSEPLIIPDARLDPRFAGNPLVTGEPYIRFYAGVQLKNRKGFNIGTLCCMDTKPREPTPSQVAMLQDFARLVMDEFNLRLLATTDSLTGAMTRRTFKDAARRDFALARRHRRPLSCVLIDVDHFKTVNDAYGHVAGDEVLRRLVAVFRTQLRNSDYVGRIGGEEFALVLRETKVDAALEVAERLRVLVSEQTFLVATRTFAVTISVGVAGMTAAEADIDNLIGNADRALYQAKATGRNCTVLHDESLRSLNLVF